MKAMILAAGLGTRLRPLTADRPKALVEIGERTLLEMTLKRLESFGIREVIVNVHHFAEMVVDYLKANNNFGMEIEVSREDELLLDTGGGLKKAGWFFLRDRHSMEEPFVLHNVDVVSTIDLREMLRDHQLNGSLATLAVMKRESSRQLLFDDDEKLCGRQVLGREPEIVRREEELQPLAFCGVHVISARFLGLMQGEGAFSIIDSYLQAVRSGEAIRAFRADEYYWRDLGRLEDLKKAEEDVQKNLIA